MVQTRMIMMLGIFCVGILVLTGCQRITDNPVANTNSNSVNVPRINLIVGDTQFLFGEWRPPISLGTPFTPGMQVPIKFIILDQTGNPVKSGVEATIIIGDVISDLAVIDDSTTGQWITNVTLPDVGTYDVVLIGNVMNVTPLTITVEVAVPQGNTDSTTGGGCDHHNDGGGCDHHNDGGGCGDSHSGCDNGWGNYTGGNCGSGGNSNSGYGTGWGNSNNGNCGGGGKSNSGYGTGWGNSNNGNCGGGGKSNSGYGTGWGNSNNGNCGGGGKSNSGYGTGWGNSNGGKSGNSGNRSNTNNGHSSTGGNGCNSYGKF